MLKRRRLAVYGLTVSLVASVLSVMTTAAPTAAAVLPSGFQEQVVFAGLTQPTNLVFAPDGRIFVAEKRGTIKVFDNLADTTATTFADLSPVVHNLHDRGLLGLALPPTFPADPYVYVLYTHDDPAFLTNPPQPDSCANANSGTCIVTGRLSRLQAQGNVMTGTEQVLIANWCQQFGSHSIGDLQFGADGALYVTSGDGASYNNVDYGNFNGNPCGDPVNEGGALRSQDSRTAADATGLDGTLLRLDPATGAAMAGNPNIGSADLNTRRIVAQGLRNPYRFTMRPGTNEAWIGDVGWTTWEEVNRVVNPTAGVTNFGWPCYEGAATQGGYQGAGLALCQSLSPAMHTAPYYTYSHAAKVVANEACPTGSSSVSGSAFYPTSGGPYPAAYAGALFFADYSRRCIWAMKPTTPGGLPSVSNIETFASAAAGPVDVEVGPGAELYYVDIDGGSIRRLRYFPANQPPQASISATPTSGGSPLAVAFDGRGSTDADPADQSRLTYEWDFTDNGSVDSTSATPSFTYTPAGSYTARLTVRDTLGATGTTTVTIDAGNDAPTAVIDTPVSATTWKVGDPIAFTGHATDPQLGPLPASALTWELRLQHCQTLDSCHTHFLQTWSGVASGSFPAPDHEYPSYLELVLTATDPGGLTSTVVRRLDPQTVNLIFTSVPSGLQVAVGSTSEATPFTRTVIVGSTNTVSAPSPQTGGGLPYNFESWSHGAARTHVLTAPATAASYTATFALSDSAANVTGTVTLGGGPAVGATVTLTPSGRSTVTDAAGAYTFTAVPTGQYTLGATLAASLCGQATSVPVTVSGSVNVPIVVTARKDAFGYACADGPTTFVPGTTVLPLTGDDEVYQLATPFPIKLYGSNYTNAWIQTNGLISFTNPGAATNNFGWHIPDTRLPKPAVLPFWDDLLIDASASVRTATIGTAPNRQLVVEWRNATFWQNTSRVTVEVIFHENGTITFAYTTPNSGNRATGSTATTGLLNGAGTSGFEYSFQQANLTAGRGVTFTPPAPQAGGSLSGTVRQAGTGTPIAGSTVTITPGGQTTTTAADGSYSFATVVHGSHTVSAAAASRCSSGSVSAPVTVDGAEVVDLTMSLTLTKDAFGYSCADGPTTFVPGTTVLPLTGDDEVYQLATPFPIKLYGSNYTNAWIQTNGLISFTNPGAATNNFGWHIPDTRLPKPAVLPFWDDLLIDASASVRTATIGTAPNRQLVVEWRNATFWQNTSRVTVEVIFHENGTITFAYTTPNSGNRATGSTATTGLLNGAGTSGFEYSFRQTVLTPGRGVTFTPPA